MAQMYLGYLPGSDPLYGYLRYDIFPQVQSEDATAFRVFRLSGSNEVYLYEEKHTLRKVIGKFYNSGRNRNADLAHRRMEREFQNTWRLRNFGFDGGWHYISRPLGCNPYLNELLVTEYCYGEALDSIITRSITGHDDDLLFRKLSALGYFLATLHNRTAENRNVDFNESCNYMNCLLGTLSYCGMLYPHERGELEFRREEWKRRACMWEDCSVLVHGDATPSNFLFGDGLHVITFDLERVRSTDRAFDVGRIAGELTHFFLRSTGSGDTAERFIGHFLWEYACHFPDRRRAFDHITLRIPFYMGLTLLRIARNNYLPRDYRRSLIEKAKQCLIVRSNG